MTWLLIYVLIVSLYDLRAHRIPNWCTLPIIIVGLILHFPGSMDVWLASFILFWGWANRWMGAGDAKLWLALLWMLPAEYSSQSFLIMCITLFATALIQTLWRFLRKQRITDSLTPAAWRTISFVLLCWYVH